MHKFLETHGRSIFKAITWKIIATIITFGILYKETGNFSSSARFSGLIFVAGLIAYYLHERTWNHIHWGKHKHTPILESVTNGER